jgi:LacI family transcriptional regulator
MLLDLRTKGRQVSVTIYDIARRAKVGIGTVSRVLNNHPSVSAQTRQHVLSIAEKMDYHPNASAQRLARRKSRTVTVMMPYITNYFFVEMLGGIQDTLFKQDYDMMLYGVNHPRQVENYFQRSIRVGHSDGILVASLDIPQTYSQKCLRDNFPLIMLDRYNEHFDSYSVDNTAGARAATEFLVSLGHRNIAMITGIAESIPSIERTAGYKLALSAAGDVRDLGVFHPEHELMNDGFSKESGYEVMKRILGLPRDQQPTGVFIASDIQAFGAIHALHEGNRSCPDDVSIVSFDDIELSNYYGLTTMRQPIHAIGVLATTRLFERLDQPQLPAEHSVFKPELVIRNTAAAPTQSHDL